MVKTAALTWKCWCCSKRKKLKITQLPYGHGQKGIMLRANNKKKTKYKQKNGHHPVQQYSASDNNHIYKIEEDRNHGQHNNNMNKRLILHIHL